MSLEYGWVLPPSVQTSSTVAPLGFVVPLEKIPYRVNAPKLTQAVLGKNYHYFKLRLHDIPKYFQVKKSWNHDYPPGQHIYSDTPAACALRNAISAEHSLLYSGRSGRDGNVEGMLERKPDAFFQMLETYRDTEAGGISIETIRSFFPRQNSNPNCPEVYTYVLLDDSLRFSRCGATMRVDMSSKHALHAGAAYEVFYAGEFWVEVNDGRKVLYVDNNSGTFAPPGHDLYRIKGLLEANFPGIQIVVFDYQDPQWKVHRKV